MIANIQLKLNKDENVHKFALSAIRGIFWREKEGKIDREGECV